MTTTTSSTLVLKNQAGDYFLLPQEVLERGRVPDERKAEVEQQVAGAEVFALIDREDVQGYLAPLAGWVIGCAISGAWNAFAIGSGLYDDLFDTAASRLGR